MILGVMNHRPCSRCPFAAFSVEGCISMGWMERPIGTDAPLNRTWSMQGDVRPMMIQDLKDRLRVSEEQLLRLRGHL